MMLKWSLLCTLLPSLLFSEILTEENNPPPPVEKTVQENSERPPLADDLLPGLRRNATLLFYLLDKARHSMLAPFSIDSSLFLAYVGSGGTTTKELQGALHQSLNPTQLATAYQTLYTQYQGGRDSYRLLLAQAIWITEAATPLPAYSKQVSSFLYGKAQQVNFSDRAKVVERLNQWVAEETEQEIQTSFKTTDIEPGTTLLVTSAFSLKGEWEKPFEKKKSSKELFYPTSNDPIPINMMKQVGSFLYFENEETALLSLPIKKAKEAPSLAFVIFLPKKQVTGELFNYYYSLAQEKEEGFLSYLEEMKMVPLGIKIPTLSLRTDLAISPLLYAIGMKNLFSTQANFSSIDNTHKLSLGQVIHQCHLLINEAGFSTSAHQESTAAEETLKEDQVASFAATRPFLYLVVDLQTKLIFSIGEYNGPPLPLQASPPKPTKQKFSEK